MHIDYEGNPLKMKKIVSALFKYKWVNLLIFFTFLMLGYLYYKLAQPVYQSSATIEIKNIQNNRQNIFNNPLMQSAGLETEIDILKSNFLIEQTLKNIGFDVSYIKKDKLKTVQKYKNSPFRVENFIIYNPTLYGKKITIKEVGENGFKLNIEKSLLSRLLSNFRNEENPLVGFHKVYQFNKPFVTKDVAFKISRNRTFKREKYQFVLNSSENILAQVRENLSIAPASFQSTILKLRFKDAMAKRAKDFLNKHIKNYMHYSTKNQTEMEYKKLTFINEQLDTINSKLQNSENKLEGFKINNDISDIQIQVQSSINKITLLEAALQEASIEKNAVYTLFNEVKSGNYSIISSMGEHYPVLNTMTETLEELKVRREGLLVTLTHAHPEVKSTERSISNIKTSMYKIVKGIKGQVDDKYKELSQELKRNQSYLKSFPQKEKELGRHERLFEVNDNVYNYLLKKQSELSIENVAQISNKKVLDYARVVPRPLSPKLPLILALSSLLGLLAVLFHTILRTKLDVKIKTPEDISDITDIPLFGIIPFVKDKDLYNSAYVIEDKNSISSEAFRSIRTNLDYVVTPTKSKVILVSSAVPNEGKTVVSANLAAIMGMSEKKSIILSLDLRRPELHHKFGLSNKIGMSDVLANRVSLRDATWEHEIYPNFNIVTSGRVPPNPAELIASGKMEKILDTLKKEYDYIIIDTPPIHYVGDAMSLFKYADITLFVLKSDFSEKKYLNEIDKMVNKLGLENIGIILNSVKNKYVPKAYFDQKYMYYEPL